MMKKKSLILWLVSGLATLTAILLAAFSCGSSTSNGSSGGSGDDAADDDDNDDASPTGTVHDVTVVDYAFEPMTITIAVGDYVRWTNTSTMQHHAENGNPGDPNAGDLFDSHTLNPGASYTFQFTTAGDYVYFCAFHPTLMFGAHVIVQ